MIVNQKLIIPVRYMAKLEQLFTFVTVVEENGFAAAGRKLKISNAAVSKQITKLETTFGIHLLKRTTRNLSLTESGRLLYTLVRKLKLELKEIENLFSGMSSEPSGTLRIACAWHFAEVVLIPNLFEFYKKYPKVTIDIIYVERIPDLAKECVDISVGTAFFNSQDDILKKIAETKYIYAASNKYLKEWGIPKKPQDLLKSRYLTHLERVPDNVLSFNKKEIVVEPFMRLNDSRLMIKCALEGLGLVKLHRYALQEHINKGLLVEVLKGCDDSIQPIYLSYQPARFLSPKIRHFIDYISPKITQDVY